MCARIHNGIVAMKSRCKYFWNRERKCSCSSLWMSPSPSKSYARWILCGLLIGTHAFRPNADAPFTKIWSMVAISIGLFRVHLSIKAHLSKLLYITLDAAWDPAKIYPVNLTPLPTHHKFYFAHVITLFHSTHFSSASLSLLWNQLTLFTALPPAVLGGLG